MPLFRRNKKEEPQPSINMQASPMFKYTGTSPQQTAANLNFQFRLVLDQYKAGKVTKEQLPKVFLLLLEDNLSVYYAPRVSGLLGDTAGMDAQTKSIFETAYHTAFSQWMGFPV